METSDFCTRKRHKFSDLFTLGSFVFHESRRKWTKKSSWVLAAFIKEEYYLWHHALIALDIKPTSIEMKLLEIPWEYIVEVLYFLCGNLFSVQQCKCKWQNLKLQFAKDPVKLNKRDPDLFIEIQTCLDLYNTDGSLARDQMHHFVFLHTPINDGSDRSSDSRTFDINELILDRVSIIKKRSNYGIRDLENDLPLVLTSKTESVPRTDTLKQLQSICKQILFTLNHIRKDQYTIMCQYNMLVQVHQHILSDSGESRVNASRDPIFEFIHMSGSDPLADALL
jgi:hypothetical protein